MRLLPLLAVYLVVGVVAQPGGEAVRDEPALLAAAERLVEHGRLAAPGSDPDQREFLWHGPGLVVVLAPLVALGVPVEGIRLISPLLLFAAVVVFHRLLLTRLRPDRALMWTYALGLYAPWAIVLGTIQKEPLAVLLVVSAMLACTRALGGAGRLWVVGAGLALAALTMVRPEYGWVILALLVAALAGCAATRPRPVARRAAGATAVAALACVPWLAYTERLTGERLYWSSSSGLSLFWMSPTLPGETGEWHSPLRVHRDPALAPYRALFRRLDQVHPVASDRELRRIAAANVRERPLLYARNLAANAARLLVFAPTRPAKGPGRIALYGIFNGSLVVGVAWAGRVLWRRRRAVPRETVPFALFAVLAVVVHLPPSASPRMLMPVVPVLVWLVAQAASAPAERPRVVARETTAARRPRPALEGAAR